MELHNQSFRICRWNPEEDILGVAEAAAICYGNEPPKGYHEHKEYVGRILRKDPEHPHMTPFEHTILSVIFVTNRGVSHELVRHRIISPNQESTRFCNYSKGKFGRNVHFIRDDAVIKKIGLARFEQDCLDCEKNYFYRLDKGCTLDEARGVLNNDVKTQIKVTTNYREWRHIFTLRCDDKHAHYQMVELMTPLLELVKFELPMIFGDISMKE